MLSNETPSVFANDTEDTNVTSDVSGPVYDTQILTILTPMYWTLTVVIVAVNGALLFLYFKDKGVRLSLNYFVVSQIIIDIMVGLVGIPLVLLYPRQRLARNTDVPDGVCVVTLLLQLAITTIEPWGVTFIAIDRLVAVARPSSYKMAITNRRSAVAIISLWCFVLFVNILPLMNLDSIGGEQWRSYCSGRYRYPIAYLHAIVYLLFAIPVVLTVVCYIAMYVVIKRKNNQSSVADSGESQPSFQKAVRAAKTCLITTLLVCLGWVPYLGFMTVLPLIPNVPFTTRLYSFALTFLFAAAVSAANPLVYFVRSHTIKTAIRRTFGTRIVPVNVPSNGATSSVFNASLIRSQQNTTIITRMTVNAKVNSTLAPKTENTNKPHVRLKPRSSRMER
ncbi:adenosine receptor A1-like [Liolophura sinensis]|uniref:adenosine receptor A1-like n=1 Tax=Liolophura sinensis TaxID=3198878 RepID=UPI0031587FD8